MMKLTERAKCAKHPISRGLMQCMLAKKTNLALSADLTDADAILALADAVGSQICVLKTHIDIIENFTPAFTIKLRALADKHQFYIFEDRKFADIGNTVKAQYQGGIYRIAEWADIVNAHVLPGEGIIEGLASVGLPRQRGLLLLAEMSSRGHLMTAEYQNATVRMALTYPAFVFGFITQHGLTQCSDWINMTPGVQLDAANDALGQQYITPENAIIENKNDIIIVGRGIIHAENVLDAAKAYQAAGWQALSQRDNA